MAYPFVKTVVQNQFELVKDLISLSPESVSMVELRNLCSETMCLFSTRQLPESLIVRIHLLASHVGRMYFAVNSIWSVVTWSNSEHPQVHLNLPQIGVTSLCMTFFAAVYLRMMWELVCDCSNIYRLGNQEGTSTTKTETRCPVSRLQGKNTTRTSAPAWDKASATSRLCQRAIALVSATLMLACGSSVPLNPLEPHELTPKTLGKL